jgi:hypothetical protein
VLVFTAETQLSDEYTKANNLYRDTTLNADPEKKGYIEANRRVRAIKFRGHRSDALVMPVDSLAFTGIDVSKLKEGDTFDELAGIEICRKYEVAKKVGTQKTSFKEEKFKRIDNKFLPEHLATSHWFRQLDSIPDDAEVADLRILAHDGLIAKQGSAHHVVAVRQHVDCTNRRDHSHVVRVLRFLESKRHCCRCLVD